MSRDSDIQSEIVVKRSSWSKKRNRDGMRSDLTPAKKRLSAEKCKPAEDRNITQIRIEDTVPEQVALLSLSVTLLNILSARRLSESKPRRVNVDDFIE